MPSRLSSVGWFAGTFAIVLVATVAGSWISNLVITRLDRSSEAPIVLKADTAARGKSLSMATGLVDRDEFVEGLFVLDHLSGDIAMLGHQPTHGTFFRSLRRQCQ